MRILTHYSGVFLTLCMLYSVQNIASPAANDKLTLCVACHATNSQPINPLWPTLAGQHASYLIKQLHDYQTGKTRQDPTMQAITATLSEEDIKALAQIYAQTPAPLRTHQAPQASRGEILYRYGDRKARIPACMTCHGPHGIGNAQANFPVIAGQQPAYTIQQLLNFKQETRRNDLNHIMRDISQRLSKKDRQELAEYLFRSLN